MSKEYRSCRWLEGGIYFSFGDLYVCCIRHSSNKGCPQICDFHGGPLPLEKIRETKRDLKEKNQLDVDTPCKGCGHLEKRRWKKKVYPLDLIGIGNFTVCNLACSYCYTSQLDSQHIADLRKPTYEILPLVESLIERGLLAPDSNVLWGGGEPTLLGEFEPVMGLMLGHGAKAEINTNGTILSDAIKRGFASGQIEALVCSVDAGMRETFLDMKKVDLFDTVWENLKQYVRMDRDKVITAKYVFVKQNTSEKDIVGFVEHCSRCGIGKIAIDVDYGQLSGTMDAAFVEAMARMAFEVINRGIFFSWGANMDKRDGLRIRLKLLEHVLDRLDCVDGNSFYDHYCDIIDSLAEELVRDEASRTRIARNVISVSATRLGRLTEARHVGRLSRGVQALRKLYLRFLVKCLRDQ